MMEETVSLENGHYEVGMLWKDEDVKLPNNRHMALKRLEYLKSRLQKDETLHQKYQTKIEEHVSKGYATKLKTEEEVTTSARTWYLPHHPVFHPAKPEKLRVVFDAAAKYEGTSLNDNLFHGPNLANDMIDVLLRFRKENIAVMADIQEMFLQVRVPLDQRDSLRFLWFTSNLDEPPETYHMNVHIFGAKDSPSIANFALQKTAKDNACEFDKETIETLEKDFYVDDLLKSVTTEDKAIQLLSNLTKLLNKGGFRLTKFTSNSRRVLSAFPASERANASSNLDLDKLPTERALGVQWNIEDDVFQFRVIKVDKPETKRGILSTVASLFDPLGFIAPVSLLVKSLLQKLWQKKLDWDQPLSEEELHCWRRWKSEQHCLSNLNVSRCYKSNVKDIESTTVKHVKDIQLHNFSDASEKGYGSASYIRTEFTDGSVICSLVFGKSRTSPLRKITIPRLELQAAVVSVRIGERILREVGVKFSKIYYWTDSEVVLKYIFNEEKRFTVYVGNRVAEIREKTQLEQWRYCPSQFNPSDDASRGLFPSQLTQDSRWLNGPSFLNDKESTWPKTSLERLEHNRSDEEEYQTNATTCIAISLLYILLERYSSWRLLKSKIVWLTRFKKYIKGYKSNDLVCSRGIPTPDELETAEKDIIRIVQKQFYPEEYLSLQKGRNVKSSSSIVRLSPFLGDDNLIRVGSRLEQAPLSYDARFPPIVPKQHWIAELMSRDVHCDNAHSGQEHTLNLLRQKVWICHARSLVRRIINKCFIC